MKRIALLLLITTGWARASWISKPRKHDSHHHDENKKEEPPDEQLAAPTTLETSLYSEMLTDDNFNEFLVDNTHAFIWFFAPWCVWCQRLAPTWEEFGKKLQEHPTLKVRLAKVDCMAFRDNCQEQKVMAFPTLRWYENGEVAPPDFTGDRRVSALMDFVMERLGVKKEERNMDDVQDAQDFGDDDVSEDDHSSNEASTLIVPTSEKEPEVSHHITPLISDVNSKMWEMCLSAGLAFGDLHQLSRVGGSEFVEFGKQVRIAPQCHSPSANPRGQYNSYFRPCNILFHSAPRESHKRRSFNKLPTVCTWENSIGPDGSLLPEFSTENIIQDYVRGWPDECVGDFKRCYSVEKDVKIFLKHFCIQKWEIPDRATHISVDCSADKALAREHNDKGGPDDVYKQMISANREQARKHHLEKIAIFVGLIIFICCCCWGFLILAYKAIFVPYLKALKKSKSDPDLQSLMKSAEEPAKDSGTMESF